MNESALSPIERQAVALAGVTQSARLVDQLARTGSYPLEFLEPSIHSLFEFDPDAVETIYGGLPGVKLGLDSLASILANKQAQENREVVRYVFGLLYLERKFASNPGMMSVVRSRLEHTSFRAEHFAGNANTICNSLSGIYQDTLSQLTFRIKVTGNAEYLQDSRNADTIRALLLAGIRSAYLWRQLGGRRWKLLVQRRALMQAALKLSRGLGVV